MRMWLFSETSWAFGMRNRNASLSDAAYGTATMKISLNIVKRKMKKTFDGVKDIIEKYSDGKINPLDDCENTIRAYLEENGKNNQYRKLADRYKKYNDIWLKDEVIFEDCNCADKLFYLLLRNKCRMNTYVYEFPLSDGNTVTANVDVFNPFRKVTFKGQTIEMINPQWHLLISYYAYIDVVFNYADNEELFKLTGWSRRKPIRRSFTNNVLKTWMEEAMLR